MTRLMDMHRGRKEKWLMRHPPSPLSRLRVAHQGEVKVPIFQHESQSSYRSDPNLRYPGAG